MIETAAYAVIGYMVISALVLGMIVGCLVIRLLAAYFRYQFKQALNARGLKFKLEGDNRKWRG